MGLFRDNGKYNGTFKDGPPEVDQAPRRVPVPVARKPQLSRAPREAEPKMRVAHGMFFLACE